MIRAARCTAHAVALVAATACAAQGAAAACTVVPRASVTFQRVGGLLLVPVTINDTVADFVLDTGAERSVVGIAAADRLHLARDEWVSTDIQGAGGRDRRRLGRPSSLSLGSVALRRHTVAQDNSVVVGPIPEAIGGRPIAGLLGEDFLSPFDLDLDPAASKLTLYAVSACSGRFLPWLGPYQAIGAGRPVRNMLTLPLRIGGAMLQAQLDSGAASSVITLPGMLQLGLAGGGSDTVRGFGPGSLAARTQRFTVQVGSLPAAPAELVVSPIRTLRSIGALLGADWLASRHVWISWATSQVFVALPG
jgi:hypothetical protein